MHTASSRHGPFFSVKASFFVPVSVLCLVKHPGTNSFCQHKCACAALLSEIYVCCGLLDCCVGLQSWAVIGEVYQLQDVDFNHLNASFPQKSMLAQADHSSVVFGWGIDGVPCVKLGEWFPCLTHLDVSHIDWTSSESGLCHVFSCVLALQQNLNCSSSFSPARIWG